MKLRNQITLSFLLVIVLITASMLYISINTLNNFSELNIRSSQSIIKEVTKDNCDISEEMLSKYSKKMIRIEARSLSREITHIISLMKKPYNYFDLRANSQLRAIAERNIYSLNQNIGYFSIIDRKGESILHSRESMESKLISELESKYPAMWELVLDSFSKNEVEGEFKLRDDAGVKTRKYIFLVNIKGTPFSLCAMVNMNNLFNGVHKEIANAEQEANEDSVELTRAVLLKMKSRYIKLAAIYAGCILFFGIIYGVLLGNYISKPIGKLQKAIKDIQEGCIPECLKEEGSSETKDVTQSFNAMTTILKRGDIQMALSKAKNKKKE